MVWSCGWAEAMEDGRAERALTGRTQRVDADGAAAGGERARVDARVTIRCVCQSDCK